MLHWTFQPGPPPSYFSCSKCGTSNQPYARFCVSCGVFIEPPSRQSSPASPMDRGDSLGSAQVGHTVLQSQVWTQLRGCSTVGMDQHSSIHFLGQCCRRGAQGQTQTPWFCFLLNSSLSPRPWSSLFLNGKVRNYQPFKSLSSLSTDLNSLSTSVLLVVNYLWSADILSCKCSSGFKTLF